MQEKLNIATAVSGMNRDSIPGQLSSGQIIFALNAITEGFSESTSYTLQNDQSNIGCITFPEGYKVIGAKNIQEINRVVFFLANPSTGNSEIGFADNGKCQYTTLITDFGNQTNGQCLLNFDIGHPIHKIITKTTNCSTQIYWTDGLNPRRYLDFADLPWKEIVDPNNDYKKIKLDGQLDCNKLNVQPDFLVPYIEPEEVVIGGSLVEGTYQFAVQYSNSAGEGYTSYYNVSNPVPIFEDSFSPDFNTVTSKAITINVLDIDISGLYEYFNIAVIKTINGASTVELAETFPTSAATLGPDGRTSFRYTYTGPNVSPLPLSITDILLKFNYYDVAGDITEVDNVLVWSNLEANETINYQPIWKDVKLEWETYKIPYNSFEGYTNGINTTLYRGYMRDEVYAFEGAFILKNGKETKSFHIPGRTATPQDREIVGTDNRDNITVNNPCEEPIAKEKWQVYNTGNRIDYTEAFKEWQANNPPTVIVTPNGGQTIAGNLHIDCDNGGMGCSQGGVGLTFTFNNPTPSSGITIQIAFETSSFAMGWNIGYAPTQPPSGFYGAVPFSVNIPGNVTTFTIAAATISNGTNTWVCLPCLNNLQRVFTKVLCNTAQFTITTFQAVDPSITNIGDSCSSTTTTISNDNCYVGSYEYGSFAYWESQRTYPNNIDIWGDLRGTKIRHHKFPDVLVSPIHTQNTTQDDPNDLRDYKNFEYAIFPIGVRIDISTLKNAIENSSLTREQKDSIVGFKIFRGNRASNKSVVAKGILHNVGKSTYDNKDYYYPNYPYNDVRRDPYYLRAQGSRGTIATTPFTSAIFVEGIPLPLGGSSQLSNYYLDGFTEEPDRFVFHSPDTHFYQPSVANDGSYLKLEAITYGKSFGHFIKVEDNAEYKFLTRDSLIASAGLALASGITVGAGSFGSPTFNIASAGAVYTAFNDIFEKITPFTNFGYTFNSIGIYGNYLPIPNYYNSGGNIGFKNRNIDYLRYVTDGGNGIEEGNTLNNFRRESSIYIHTDDSLLYSTGYGAIQDNSRYTLQSIGDGLSPETVRETNISSYYGAIKRDLPSQWEGLYSYETIDTGYYQPLYPNSIPILQKDVPAIFGGDIFINRFGYKSKQSIFKRTTVGAPNSTDINYDELGTINYPAYWISTDPMDFDIDVEAEVQAVLAEIDSPNFMSVLGNILSGGGRAVSKANNLIIALLKEIYNKAGIKNINLDRWDLENGQSHGINERGLIYLFNYGIPYFFCESEVNVDYRQAYDELVGNFYPKVSNDIPDDWLQEINVPIINDNTYTYNRTYSKQNKESFTDHLKEDFDPSLLCTTDFPNRAIWSDKSSQEESRNNWLIYRPSAYYDFPKSSGPLVSLDKIQNIEVLARFENKTQKYNALTTIQVSDGPQGYLGNPALFSGTPPVDIAETDNGYAGSQNKFLLRTEFGTIITDAKRGQIILLSSQGTQTISNLGMSKWFAENLPFTVLEYDPTFPTDNHFNGVGITGVYDQFYQRVLITKTDFEPKEFVILFDGKAYFDPAFIDNKPTLPFFTENTIEVPLGDSTYFTNKSWSISFSFRTNSWISFHSFIPDYYVAYPTYFQTGLNPVTPPYGEFDIRENIFSTLWSHNKTFTSYHNYYNISYPFILEYPFVYKLQDEILQSVKTYCTSRIYENFDTFYEPNEIIFFNKAIVYNNQQCSGMRNLVPKPKNNLSTYLTYPKYNTDSIDILVSKVDNLFIFNNLWDISIDKSEPMFLSTDSFIDEDKELNQDNMNYTNSASTFKKAPLRAKEAYVRFILDNRTDVKLIQKFAITQTSPSYS